MDADCLKALKSLYDRHGMLSDLSGQIVKQIKTVPQLLAYGYAITQGYFKDTFFYEGYDKEFFTEAPAMKLISDVNRLGIMTNNYQAGAYGTIGLDGQWWYQKPYLSGFTSRETARKIASYLPRYYVRYLVVFPSGDYYGDAKSTCLKSRASPIADLEDENCNTWFKSSVFIDDGAPDIEYVSHIPGVAFIEIINKNYGRGDPFRLYKLVLKILRL